MPTVPYVFPLWRIALTAVIAAGVGLVVLRWRFKHMTISETTFAALIVGLSVLAWRLSANVPSLNDDPIALLSPNDCSVHCSPMSTWGYMPRCARQPTPLTGRRRARP